MKRIEQILALILREELIEEIIGDLLEYKDEISTLPAWKQNFLLWFHASQFVRPELIKPLFSFTKNNNNMLQLNLRIAWRSMAKNKIVTFNSILIMILGTLCFQSIYAWLQNENRMNQQHEKIERLYLTAVKTNPTANLTPLSLSTMFQVDWKQFPEVEQSSQVHVYSKEDAKVSADSYEHWGKAFVVDSNFFQLFDFPFQLGDPHSALVEPTNVLLTESFAKKIFGEENPMGKTLEVKCDHLDTYQVAGIIKDLPSYSSIQFDFILPRQSQPFWRRIPQEFLLTTHEFDEGVFNNKIKEAGRETNTRFPESELSVYPLNNIYADQPFTSSIFSKYGDQNAKQTMRLIALILLIITWLGFNHIQSTLLINQSRRLGIKALLGSKKYQLTEEIITSRSLLALISIAVCWLLYEWLFPIYTARLDLQLDADPVGHLLNITVIIFSMILFSLLIAQVQIRRLTVLDTLKSYQTLFRIPGLQRAITILQFGLSTALIIATLVIVRQSQFLLNQPLGFEHTSIIEIDFFEMQGNYVEETVQQQTSDRFAFLKQKLSEHPSILSVSQSDPPIQSSPNSTSWKLANGQDAYTTQYMMIVDPSYEQLLGLTVIEGRFFSDSLDQNNQPKVVINEAAARFWNIKDNNNMRLQSNTSGRSELSFEIIGVVKDFHYESLSNEIKPLVMRYRPYQDDSFLIRTHTNQEASVINYLEQLFREVNPKGIFNYALLQDQIEAQYLSEKQQKFIYLAFTIIALSLSGLCLFTYAWHEVQRRAKEIGIRKVMGADFRSIFNLISGNFLKTVALSFLIGLPLAYFFQKEWLANYAVRINVNEGVYLSAMILVLFVSLLATSWLTYTISKSNPVDSLRSE